MVATVPITQHDARVAAHLAVGDVAAVFDDRHTISHRCPRFARGRRCTATLTGAQPMTLRVYVRKTRAGDFLVSARRTA